MIKVRVRASVFISFYNLGLGETTLVLVKENRGAFQRLRGVRLSTNGSNPRFFNVRVSNEKLLDLPHWLPD